MRFLIITHTPHKKSNNKWFAYEPYVREMNIWLKYIDEVEVIAPQCKQSISKIEASYNSDIIFNTIPAINLTSIGNILKTIFYTPGIVFKIIRACMRASHIHLRCPGNIGLLGSLVQIFFPNKIKTAKYAGNWDPSSKQPLSYKFQKKILSNTFLTRNINVLVYGKWENQTKNIKPFFTASYFDKERENHVKRNYSDNLKFLFVGSLVSGKRPLMTIQIVEQLYNRGFKVNLDIYGDGILMKELVNYIKKNKLENVITLHGNSEKHQIKNAYKAAHFLILPSKSEGWPKAVAEAMFFGVIPISTSVSCIPYMLNFGKRGIIIKSKIDNAVAVIEQELNNASGLHDKSLNALQWSQKYTLDYFESEVSKLIQA